MLSDYANVIPTIIAIINSVIAVSVSHFKPERQRLKIAILVVSILLGLAAAGATIYGQYATVQKREAEVAKRNDVHSHLGELIAQGDGLLIVLRDASKPVASSEATAWALGTEQYLRGSLGPGYVERFRDSSGMVHGQPVGLDDAHIGYWNGVYERVARLQQFSAEISK
jgi:hypothetical protein